MKSKGINLKTLEVTVAEKSPYFGRNFFQTSGPVKITFSIVNFPNNAGLESRLIRDWSHFIKDLLPELYRSQRPKHLLIRI